MRRGLIFALVLAFGLSSAPASRGYSVLAHEAIIDLLWDKQIQPLLLARFPQATPQELRSAHAYAYGGAIIQDMGYYPFGSKLFSDLTHYVRSGDFIMALLRDSTNLEEYAFALGALSHWAADNDGHRLATNFAVPMLYPKLRRKYGHWMTYEDNPAAHLKVEFAFDVVQVARGSYAPDAYHDFIGFEVSQPVLQRAFRDTYALDLQDVFRNLDLALGTYRWSVSSVIPEMIKVAWDQKKDEIAKANPGITRNDYLYRLKRKQFETSWGRDYRRPGIGARVLAFIFRLIPKIGPFKALSFRTPTPVVEKMFLNSFAAATDHYRDFLKELPAGRLQLQNDNFDVGAVTPPGKYNLADQTYADLVDKLAKNNFARMDARLRDDILSYYADPNAPIATKRHHKEWVKLTRELAELKSQAAPSSGAPRGGMPPPQKNDPAQTNSRP